MFFVLKKIYEDKLSEKIKTDGWAKRKLIKMETPTKNSLIYSFFSIGLLAYCWIYQLWLMYNNAYAFEYSLFAVLIASYAFKVWYKKMHAFQLDEDGHKKMKQLTSIIFTFCIVMIIKDPIENLNYDIGKHIWDGFIINTKNPINNSYIHCILISFLSIGTAITYFDCKYKCYQYMYMAHKNANKSFKYMYIAMLLILLTGLYFFKTITTTYSFSMNLGSDYKILRSFSVFVIYLFPSIIIVLTNSAYYLAIYKLAQLSDILNKN